MKQAIRSVLFWTHLVAGVVAGLLIALMGVTGLMLAFEHQLISWAEKPSRVIEAPAAGARRLGLDELLDKVRTARPGGEPATLVLYPDPAAAVRVSVGREGGVHVDPYRGTVRDLAGQNTRDFTSFMTRWHRWLGMEGPGRDVGKAIKSAATLKHALSMEQQARMDAETANRAKDEFLAALSHELRTPMNAIIGWVDMIQKMDMDDVARDRALEVIGRNARAQAALIEDLLDVARISKGQVQLRAEPVHLPAVVSAAIDTVEPSASAKDIAVEKSITGESHLTVRGDAARLQQVVWNLLSNAVKFTPRGGKVDVTLSGDPSSAVIVVTDTGRGMDAESLARVFDRFYQTTPAAGSGEGLGLGLTIARQLVQMHGGTLTASSPGKGMGTSFVLRLPNPGSANLAVQSRR